MAITVEEVKGSRRGGWTAQGGRTYGLEVQVITDDPTIGVRAALRSVGVDAGAYYKSPLASPNEWDYGAWLNGIEATETSADGKQWLVTLNYATVNWQELQGGQGNGADPSNFTANPLNAPPSVQWGAESLEVAATLDRDGTPILNSAGDPFDPPLTKIQSIPVATVTRMLASFDPNWLVEFKDHVNGADWMDFPAGTVLIKDMTADRTYDNDFGWMWQQRIVFGFRPIIVAETPNPDAPWQTDTDVISPGWATQVLNSGLRQRVPDPANVGEFLMEQILIDGSPASSEVYLKSDGTFDPNSNPNYLTFQLYEEADFGGLDLPSDLFSKSANSSAVGGS